MWDGGEDREDNGVFYFAFIIFHRTLYITVNVEYLPSVDFSSLTAAAGGGNIEIKNKGRVKLNFFFIDTRKTRARHIMRVAGGLVPFRNSTSNLSNVECRGPGFETLPVVSPSASRAPAGPNSGRTARTWLMKRPFRQTIGIIHVCTSRRPATRGGEIFDFQ